MPSSDDDEYSARPSPSASNRGPGLFIAGLIGLLIGVLTTTYYYRSPVTHKGIDHNNDGVLDERWTYANKRPAKFEKDRNLDGEMDRITLFDRRGIIESELSDNDYDGDFETELRYLNGEPSWEKSDTTNDGFQDSLLTYTDGILSKAMYISPTSNMPLKIEHYEGKRLLRVEIDTDRDGTLDTVDEYDEIGEIVSSHPK